MCQVEVRGAAFLGAVILMAAATAARALPVPQHVIDVGATDDPLVQAGFLPATLYDGWNGHRVDPTGVADSTVALNQAILDGREAGLVTYLPPGTYLVSDTLIGEQLYQVWGCADHFGHPSPDYGTGFVMRKAPALVGPAAGPRPVIRLADGSSGFGDPGAPKPVLWFFNNGPGYPPQPDWWNQGDCGMNLHVRNLVVEVGQNAGAIAVQMPSAQYSALQDVQLNATGGYAGLRGAVQTQAVVNVEVIGGRYGVIFNLGSEYAAGLTLRDQTEAAILIDAYSPVTLVGLHIEKAAGPAILADGSLIGAANQGSQLTIIDGSIVVAGGSAPAIATTSSLYLRNLYVQAPADLVHAGTSVLPRAAGPWSRVTEYSYTDARDGYDSVTSRTWIEGTVGEEPVAVVAAAASAPADLVTRHTWRRLPWLADPGVKSVKDPDIGARGDGSTDDTAALQAAIDAHGSVFLPRGDYRITAGLRLHAGTRLFGVPGGKSRLFATGFTPTGAMAMLSTDDDAAATTLVSDLWLNPPGGSWEATQVTVIDWRAGRHSVVNEVYYDLPWETETATQPRQMVRITGHGGGRWYGTTFGQQYAGRTDDPAWRALLIDGTTEPLTLYGMNSEYANGPMTEIRDAANVRILGNKTEVRQPYLLLTGARNVLHAGIAGHCQDDFGVVCSNPALVIGIIDGGEGLVLANETLYASSHTPGAMLRETASGALFDAHYNCSLYRRGDVDDSLFPWCGDGVCDPVTETADECPADCALACGDGTCGAGEDCRGCPADCGPCPDGGDAGDAGGVDGAAAGGDGAHGDGAPGNGGAGELGGGCACAAGASGRAGPWAGAAALLLGLLHDRRRRRPPPAAGAHPAATVKPCALLATPTVTRADARGLDRLAVGARPGVPWA